MTLGVAEWFKKSRIGNIIKTALGSAVGGYGVLFKTRLRDPTILKAQRNSSIDSYACFESVKVR